MTPRERVRAVFARQPVDRIPVDIWMTPEVRQALLEHTGATDDLVLAQRLGIDKFLWAGPNYPFQINASDDPSGSRNTWGVTLRRVNSGKAIYEEVATHPLGEMMEPEELADYPFWPDPASYDLAPSLEAAQRAVAAGYPVMGPWISVFEIYSAMRGMENALMDLAEGSDFMEAAFDRIWGIQTAILERFLPLMGDHLDMVFISDDMGTQESLMVSVPTWERHFRDRMKGWCDLVHRHGRKVMYHTDGAVRPLIPHFIDAGIDVLNPIQHVCTGMSMRELKRDFGERVIFYGGVENQHVLPFGTPDEVRAETRDCLEALGGDKRGYICCSCHNIQAGTPVANVLAMIETALGK